MKKLFLISVCSLFVTTAIQANVILSEPFNYPDGPLVEAPSSPWTTHSGTPSQVNVLSQRVQLSFNEGEDVNAPLSGAPYDTTNNPAVSALYSSFKITFTALPSGQGSYFAHFKDQGTFNFRCRVYALTNGAATGGNFRIGVGSTNSASTTDGFVTFPLDLTLNTTYTVVTRIDVATGASTLWINPTAESDPSVSSTANPGNVIQLSSYAFRQAAGIGTNLIDDLTVGTSFNDVAGPNNPPTISAIPNQSIGANTSTPNLPFTVGDIETPANNLNVTAASSNTGLVPNGNIFIEGTGANRTVRVTPATDQQGVTTITITVTDEGNISASTSFTVSVGVPTISDIPDQTTPTNTVLGPISFTVSDNESPAGSLNVTASSSNQALVPDGNISVGGTGGARTLTITPAADTPGLAVITVTVSDGVNTASDSFVLTVNPLLGVLRSDDFNRPDGPLVQLDGQWLSNGGAGGMHLQEMQIVGNKVKVTEEGSEDVSTELPPNQQPVPVYTTSSGVILYAGMRITLTNLPTSAGSYFAHFRDGSTGFRARIFASTVNAAPGSFRLGIANNAAAIGASGQIATDLSLNTSYFIVVRYNVGTGESKLWLNPSSESSPGLLAPDNPSLTSIQAFTFRQNAGIGVVCVDDLKIGTAFSDVAGFGLQIVKMGGNIQVSWPAAADGYILQSTGSLSPANWSDHSDQGSVAGDRKVVSIVNPAGTLFFRLIKP